MNKTRNTPRTAAEQLVQRWLETGGFPDRMLDGRAETTEIVYGVVRHHRALSWIIDRFVRKSPGKKLTGLLETGIYQLLFMDTADAFAVVHETVESAKAIGGKSAGRLVNAVLRRVQREEEELLRELEAQPVGIRTSHPDLLIERWSEQFGPEGTERLCNWNNQRAQPILRRRHDNLCTRCREEGIKLEPHPSAPETFFLLPRGHTISSLPGFDEGWFYVQDPATAAAVDLLDLKPDQRVLDACAAPGGKAGLIAEAIGNTGTLIALERHDDRIGRLEENLQRLGHDNAQVIQGDATTWTAEPFDRILLDVPCSNTGVIRRRPDVRWRFESRRFGSVLRTQQQILTHGLSLLKPSGKLVYSTCSLEAEENEDLVERVLAEHPDFHVARSELRFPPDSKTDGAYAALITKNR
ncbi:MAG: 16S rRNA (cytosine(967)-C(5))-methyltransferase RsmB [Verrucomicrobiota bacterium]